MRLELKLLPIGRPYLTLELLLAEGEYPRGLPSDVYQLVPAVVT